MNKHLALFFLLVFFAGSADAQQQPFYGCFGPWGMSGYGYGFGWILMVLTTIALILFIIWLIKQVTVNERRRK